MFTSQEFITHSFYGRYFLAAINFNLKFPRFLVNFFYFSLFRFAIVLGADRFRVWDGKRDENFALVLMAD